MTRFRFRLDRVLKLREGVEKLRAADLGRALSDEARQQGHLAEAESGLERAHDSATAAPAQVPAGTLHARSQALQAAADRVRDAAEDSRRAAERTEAERERFDLARRERESLERLKVTRESNWRTEAGRLEQNDVDEIVRQRRERGDSR
ncbi:MAG TPA: flagellar export protein FliJ [Candidatus Sulfotelmatobacter sp.]|nr:flagellar export protein FliJ [Candidatus Sulfotelmatobacter sp.]